MTFTQAVRSALSSYATFSGRARRAEYWWFYLFTVLVSLASSALDAVLDTAFDNEAGVVGAVTGLALLLPTLAVTARRLHDTGRSGWWMLLPVVPLLSTILVGFSAAFVTAFTAGTNGAPAAAMTVLVVVCLLTTLAGYVTLTVLLCLDSRPGPNRYGPSPKDPPMPPDGPGGYYLPAWYGPHHPAAGYGQPYGHPYGQPYGHPYQPPAPPPSGFYPPQP